MPIFQPNLTCSWAFYQMVRLILYSCSQPACFSGDTGQRFWTCSTLPLSQTAIVLWSSFPRPGKQPCHRDQCEESFRAINLANLLGGFWVPWFRLSCLITNKPCMDYMCFLTVFGQAEKQNKKMQWLEGFCLFKKKKKERKKTQMLP